MQRKAMTTAITLIVTLVVVLAIGLIVYMISSGILTDFGLFSKEQHTSSFDTIKCTTACNECCMTGTGNDYYKDKDDADVCKTEDASVCGDCNCG